MEIFGVQKDMIVPGGYNTYPNEIDDALFDHPKILEACAVSVPDEYRGETVKVLSSSGLGETLTAEEVIAYARGRLALYKVSLQIAFLDAQPKSAVGKILRLELRALDAKS